MKAATTSVETPCLAGDVLELGMHRLTAIAAAPLLESKVERVQLATEALQGRVKKLHPKLRAATREIDGEITPREEVLKQLAIERKDAFPAELHAFDVQKATTEKELLELREKRAQTGKK